MNEDNEKRPGVAWASTFAFIALLAFVFGLVYLAHNHWQF